MEPELDLEETGSDLKEWLNDPLVAGIAIATAVGVSAILVANFMPESAPRAKEKNFYIPFQPQPVETEKRIERTEKPLSQILEEKRARAELVDRENYIYYTDPRTKKMMRKAKDILDYQSLMGSPVEED